MTIIPKVGFWGGWGGLNIPLVIPYADIVKLTLNLSSPPSVIQIWPKTDAQRHELVSHGKPFPSGNPNPHTL